MLLLNVAVLDHDLLVVVLHESRELLDHAHLQLLKIVNVLGYPVDRILEASNVARIRADRGVGCADSCLHVFLFEAEIFDKETEVGVQRIELLKLEIHCLRLITQLSCLNLLRRDLFLQLLNTIIKHKFELFELLSLLLQLVDLLLAFANARIFLSNLLVQQLDVILMILSNLLLLLYRTRLISNVSL